MAKWTKVVLQNTITEEIKTYKSTLTTFCLIFNVEKKHMHSATQTLSARLAQNGT